MAMELKDRIIVALDVGNVESCKRILESLSPSVKMFKIGSQLFTAAGQEAISAIKEKGAGCFLDLKFHDIPATVGKASALATSLGVDIFNVHASGGFDMMRAASESSKEVARRLNIKCPLLLAVTVLTSISEDALKDLGIERGLEEQVLFLATLAKKAGLDGVVASAGEVSSIKRNLGSDFIVVVPGVRPLWAQMDDQRRVMTPKEAFDRGADYIVIGRPITKSEDPKAAIDRIIKEIG